MSEPMSGMPPSVGRIVHYVLPNGPSRGEIRPAMVVRIWAPDSINLQVFTDSDQDGDYNDQLACPFWATLVPYDPEGKRAGSWHWPQRTP